MLSTVTFHGKTGAPTWPKAKEVEKYSLAERNQLVKHAKRVLVQEWLPEPIVTSLVRKGWFALPAGVWQLSDAVACQGKEIPFPKAQLPRSASEVEKPPRAAPACVE